MKNWTVRQFKTQVAVVDKDLEMHAKNENIVDPMPICILKADEREGYFQDAVATLISAAPDMLEALKKTLDYLESEARDSGHLPNSWDREFFYNQSHIKTIVRAIRKAENDQAK